jgi:hypothetical protein
MGRKKLTDEEKAARAAKQTIKIWESTLRREKLDCYKCVLPRPSWKAAIGDRVTYGNWDWTAVLETFKGSRVYKLISVSKTSRGSVGRTTGQLNRCTFKIHYEPWYSLRPFRPSSIFPHMPRFEQDDDIHFTFQNRDIRSLIHMCLNEYGIDFNPEYQRGHVWEHEQKVNLIDSIMKHIDIGKFAIIHREFKLGEKSYEMLDGKQRVSALLEFYLGRFTYKGRTFQSLHPRDQHHFMSYNLSYAESRDLTQEQKLRYFLKLNTTGTPVDPAHMERVAKMLEKEMVKKIEPDYISKRNDAQRWAGRA